MSRIRNGLGDRSETERFGRGEGSRVNEGLLVLQIFVEGEQKTGVLAVSNGAGDRAFVVLSALVRLNHGEGIGRVENGIAKQEIYGPVINRRSALGHDFQASPAGTRKVRGVGIVVDLHFLHRGGSYARSIGFNAVHDERGAVSAGSVVVEGWRHGCD